MTRKDFFQFVSGCRTKNVRNSEILPLLNSMCEVKFVKNVNTMLYKTSFSQDYEETFFLRPRFNLFEYPSPAVAERGITSTKRKAIIDVMKDAAVPVQYMDFRTSMTVNETVVDSVTCRE